MKYRTRSFVSTVCVAALLALCGAAHAQVLEPIRPPVGQVDTSPRPPNVDPNQQVIDSGNNPGGGLEALPVLMRPGRHTVTLQVADERRFFVNRSFGSACSHGMPFGDPNLIGFAQSELWGINNACGAHLLQRTLRFDTTLFEQVDGELIERAVLTYDETPASNCTLYAVVVDPRTNQPYLGGPLPAGPSSCWADGEGEPENKPEGCVDVRIPYSDWRTVPAPLWRHAVATASDGGPTVRLSPRSWDVTVPLNYQVGSGPPLGAQRRVGFLLSGWPVTMDQLTADDNTRCVSVVTNVQLEVTYFVPSSGGFVQPN